jgi:hypothetical protein
VTPVEAREGGPDPDPLESLEETDGEAWMEGDVREAKTYRSRV